MEVHFTPEVQAKLERLASDTGRPTNELLQDALAGYFDELASTREMLDSRYDDLKSGRVKPVSGAEVKARLKAKSDAWRAEHQ
jgi:predicted DNA-binding protein